MGKLLITGAAGHLGEALMRLAPEEGWEPVGIDRRAGAYVDHVGDIADTTFVRRVMAGALGVIHAATLHKPHVITHSVHDFVSTNITGTLTLLEGAAELGIRPFIFTSTTSAFGSALRPGPNDPAAWIDETVIGTPKNIYGATKTAAEGLCQLFANTRGVDAIILRTSRFFAEADDDPIARAAFVDENLKANEFLHRRVDIEDAARAHFCALEQAEPQNGEMFIVSAPTPFRREDAHALRSDPEKTVEVRAPGCTATYAARGYRLTPDISRVYDSSKAMQQLGWQPRYDFAKILQQITEGDPIGSALARKIGARGYHENANGESFAAGLYPVEKG